jgi:hypothetical protein
MTRSFIVALVILVIGASACGAEEMRPILRFGGGIAIPMEPDLFTEYWKTGFSVGGGIGLAYTELLEAYTAIGFGRNGGEGTTDALHFLTVFGDIKVNLLHDSKVTPYILAGAGLFRRSGGGYDENAFGFHAALGVSVDINERMAFNIDGDYLIGATEGDSTVLINARAGLAIQM